MEILIEGHRAHGRQEVMMEILIEGPRAHGRQEVMMENQHGLTKGKSSLTDLIDFYDGTDASVDEGRAADIIYLDFNKASDVGPHSILMSK